MIKISTKICGKCLTVMLFALLGGSVERPAKAQQTAGATNTRLSSEGRLKVKQGRTTLQCRLTGTAKIAAIGKADNKAASKNIPRGSVSALAFKGFFCSTIRFAGLPYAVTLSGSSSIVIKNVQVVSPVGKCSGDLRGTLNQDTGQISFSDVIIPAARANGDDCGIAGQINTVPAVRF